MLHFHRVSARILSIAAVLAFGAAACVNEPTAPTPTKPLLSQVPGDNALASDNFDRADQNPLAGNWTIAPPSPWSQFLALSSNHVVPTSMDADGEAYYSAISWPADQYSKAKLYVNGTGGANQGFGLMVRQSASARTHYRLIVDHASSANVGLEKMIDNTFTNLVYFTESWTDGDEWELRVTGTRLQIFRNGSQVGTDVSDGEISSGSPGIAYSSTANWGAIDDWEGGGFGSDPDSTRAGVYLGFGWDSCFTSAGATGPDTDQDGLTDQCEQALADAFAPELKYNPNYDMGREPHWAARPTAANEVYGPYKVVIVYLLSYFIDNGDTFQHIDPHKGDSEVIGLTVYYNGTTQHWILDEARYSAHTHYSRFSREGWEYPLELAYPTHAGAYPLAWVASSKHGNYNSRNACNTGGIAWTDSCDGANTSVRAETYLPNGASGNIGSYAVPVDCVTKVGASANSRQECYWSPRYFRGWYDELYGGASASPYSWRMNDFGFFPPPPPTSPCGHWEVRPVYDGEGQETGSYENVWVPEECSDPPCTTGHWESRPVLDGNGEETGSYENVWVPDPGCT